MPKDLEMTSVILKEFVSARTMLLEIVVIIVKLVSSTFQPAKVM